MTDVWHGRDFRLIFHVPGTWNIRWPQLLATFQIFVPHRTCVRLLTGIPLHTSSRLTPDPWAISSGNVGVRSLEYHSPSPSSPSFVPFDFQKFHSSLISKPYARPLSFDPLSFSKTTDDRTGRQTRGSPGIPHSTTCVWRKRGYLLSHVEKSFIFEKLVFFS